jgi:phosphonopyruvate decarboxylase
LIDSLEFLDSLEKLDIRFVAGVPDSLLKDVCSCMSSRLPSSKHIIAANEGAAIGLAIGHYLATRRPALVYLQNAGLGNVINPVASLADPTAYGIPMLLMIGWRGEIGKDGIQIHDEPQHIKQGQITLRQLDIMDIPYRIADSSMTAIGTALKELVDLAMSRSGPVALVVRGKTFMPVHQAGADAYENNSLTREAALAAIIHALPDTMPIVSATGMASRELYELREAAQSGHQRDFLTIGGMGHAGQIAAGIALAKPGHRVACIDGDGAILMHMGSLAISADCNNLLHIVMNNGAHDSVGGQPTKAAILDLAGIAKACGYARAAHASTTEELKTEVRAMLNFSGSSFLEVKCRRGARPNLGRPDRTPSQNKEDFMSFLQERSHE